MVTENMVMENVSHKMIINPKLLQNLQWKPKRHILHIVRLTGTEQGSQETIKLRKEA